MTETADYPGAPLLSGTDGAQTLKMEIVGRLAAGLAHDFNNLLTIINGQSQWMLDHPRDSGPDRRGLEEILHAGQQASELTRQLLAFIRRQPVEPQRFDLNHLVDRLALMLPRLLGAHIALDIRTGAALPCLYADQHQLEQVVMNLAVNARDAMPRGGALSISTENIAIDGCSYLSLSVRDTGTGIGETVRRRMFEPFFTTRPAGEGTGLGLSRAREIVNASGGHIEVESELGRGTTVSLFWKSRDQAGAQPTPTMNPPRIVIADDYPAVRAWLRQVIQSSRNSVEILEAADGAEALRLVRAGGVDLVITDIIMPDKEGIETIQTLRREAPYVPIVAISGSAHSEYLEIARVLGANATLQKPLTADVVLAAVDRLLPHKA